MINNIINVENGILQFPHEANPLETINSNLGNYLNMLKI